MRDLLSNIKFTVFAGIIEAKVPAHSIIVLKPETGEYTEGYNRYDRIY